jgi:hypothetical protein
VTQVDYTTDADTGSTHALITVERSTTPGALDAPRAQAFAGFVRTPPEVDPNLVMRLAGLGLDLPPIGQCAEVSRDRDGSVPLRPLTRVDFLDAGDVSIRASNAASTLAPRAFPAVTDLISGVVYTTRDRAADPLPAATRYTVSAEGGALGAFSVGVDAPPELEGVQVEGAPLGSLPALSTAHPLVLSWASGAARDLVYAELSTSDRVVRCTLRDDAGGGSIPQGSLAGTGPGRFALHRVRTTPFSGSGIAVGEVRFDFQESASVVFSE